MNLSAAFRELRTLGHRALYFGHWFIAYRFGDPLDVPWERPAGFRELMPPPDRVWADPFPVLHDGQQYIFLEEKLRSTGKGHISVMRRDDEGWTTPEKVLECDCHLSYPLVFRWDGVWYMIPESSAGRRVTLYWCADFPSRWEPVHNIFENVRAVDTTLYERDGRWWMFINIAPPGGSTWNVLHIFHADTPLGPWTPHAGNPVKMDIGSARPAGRLLEHEGRLIRPSQDCSVRYGYATVFNEVRVLTAERFEEVEVGRIDPDWRPGLRGTHTFNTIAGLTVIDGLVPHWRWW